LEISIIVPVYNCANHISKTINSLLNQNFNQLYEIICIDDASTDNSLEILNAISSKNQYIQVIHLEKNKGVSNARNLGINISKGKYILFCDGDDIYHHYALKSLYNCAIANNSDMVLSNYHICKKSKLLKRNILNVYGNQNFPTKRQLLAFCDLSSCAKLIARELFFQNDLFYPLHLHNFEEYPVIPVLAQLANKVSLCREYTYVYNQNKNSASNKLQDDFSYFNESFNLFRERIFYDYKFNEELEYRMIEHFLYGKLLVMMKNKCNIRNVYYEYEKYKLSIPNYKNNKYYKKMSVFKKIFIYFIEKRYTYLVKLLVFIHSLITG
jgi:glycosyltransferase involved in cell wall biosynthesis